MNYPYDSSALKFLTIPVVLFILTSCSIIPKKYCWKVGDVQKDSTYFPGPQLDFSPSGFQARVAISAEDQRLRIWVKGDENNVWVQIFNNKDRAISLPIELHPPYFTSVIILNEQDIDSVSVRFGSMKDALPESSKRKDVYFQTLTSENDNTFSFLVYGCFQPFHVDQNGVPDLLHDSSNPLNYEMRQLFEDVGMSRALFYYPADEDTLKNTALVENPVLTIGTGDQIYVDAGYEKSDFRNHALTGWAHGCKDPYPLLDYSSYEAHIDRCYRNFYSFKCFDQVFSRMPVISVWDDHEIRDGWGSHGDEYSKNSGVMSDYLKPYFNISKLAYIKHQVVPGQEIDNQEIFLSKNISLEQVYTFKGIQIFAFDLRSHRNIHRNQTISEDQMQAFKSWCASIADNSEVIIISSMPFFYKPVMPLKILARIFKPDLRDDINDGWYSKYNEVQRNLIMKEIISLRKRNVKPIILSGDAHLGGMISAWYQAEDGQRQRLCYELIYSGLSHESLGEERKGFEIKLRDRSKGTKKKDPTFPVGEYNIEYIYEFIQGRLNFGALQFSKDENTVASLFIVDDNEKHFNQIEMPLDWDETYEEYLDRAVKIKENTYAPPTLSEHRIIRKTIK